MAPWVITLISVAGSVVVAIVSSSWFAKKVLQKDIVENLTKELRETNKTISDLQKDVKDLKDYVNVLSDASAASLKLEYTNFCKRVVNEGMVSLDDKEKINILGYYLFTIDDKDGTGKKLLEDVEKLPIKKEE